MNATLCQRTPSGLRPRRATARAVIHGFTLIELMVTVVITAILVTVATSAYSSFVLKAHRTEAKSALLNIAAMEERYLSAGAVAAGCYSSSPADVGYPAGPWSATQGITVGNGYYQVFLTTSAANLCGTIAGPGTPATPAQFTITASPIPGTQQAKDVACALYTVTSTGSRTATTSGGADNTAACWN
jgi:type IV pilus assembly protein PilE